MIKSISNKKMSDSIEEYFIQSEGNSQAITSQEIFKAEDENVDLRTHLTDEEIGYINTLEFNNLLLKQRGLKPVFSKFLNKYMRLKISKDRLSRGEFVNINRSKGDDAEVFDRLSNLKNITDAKK